MPNFESFTEEDFVEIEDAGMRALALAGCILWHWSMLERAMGNAIQEAVGSEGLLSTVIASNLAFTQKVAILKTLAHYDGASEWEKRFTKIADAYRDERNVLAHRVFGPTMTVDGELDGRGIEFNAITARGAIKFDATIWTVADCITRINRNQEWYLQIVGLGKRFGASPTISRFRRPEPGPTMDALGNVLEQVIMEVSKSPADDLS